MEPISLGESLPIWEIAKSNIKHNMVLSAAVSTAILLIAPVLFGTANLDREASAVPLEMFISLVGVVLLTPLFRPEERKEIDDLVSAKYVDMSLIYLIRIVAAILFIAGFAGAFIIYMRMRSCGASWLLFAGTVADAVFLGGLGMITAALAGNTVVGYMAPLVYYGINFGAGAKLGNFYLFSMCISAYEPKLWLFGAGVLLLSAALAVKRINMRKI